MSIPSIYYGYLLEKIKEMLPFQSCIPSWKKGPPNTSNFCRNDKLDVQKVQCSFSNGFRVMCKPSNEEKSYMQKGVKETIDEDSTNSSKQSDDLDPDYEPQENVSILLSDGESLDTSKALSDILDCSPIRFQVKRKHVDTLSDHTKKYLKQKHEQMQKQLTQKFAAFSCPGQEKNIDALQPTSSLSDSQIDIPEEILRFVNMYHHSDALGKIVILSTVDYQKFSRSALRKIFGCSKYMVDEGRKLKVLEKDL